jgi:hypothetical protein
VGCIWGHCIIISCVALAANGTGKCCPAVSGQAMFSCISFVSHKHLCGYPACTVAERHCVAVVPMALVQCCQCVRLQAMLSCSRPVSGHTSACVGIQLAQRQSARVAGCSGLDWIGLQHRVCSLSIAVGTCACNNAVWPQSGVPMHSTATSSRLEAKSSSLVPQHIRGSQGPSKFYREAPYKP